MAKDNKSTLIGDFFSLDKVTACTLLDIRRSKSDGLYPVKYRVTFLRKLSYYPSGINLSIKEWESLPKTRNHDLINSRELIQNGFEKIKKQIKSLVKGDGFSLELFNNRLSRGTKGSVFNAFEYKIEKLKKEGNIGNSEWYSCASKSIDKFVKQKLKAEDLKFSEVTPDWLESYEAELIGQDKSYNTVSMYMRALRSIINDNRDLITPAQYPFGEGKYEIPSSSKRKMALTTSQIKEVLEYPLVIDKDKMCRDYWFFSYLCNGANMKDIFNLKYKNLEDGEVRFYRKKTIRTKRDQEVIAATLLPEMLEIIDKWGNRKSNPDNYVFPVLRDGLSSEDERKLIKNATRMINQRMKKIGEALGIGKISTNSARHSFATVLKRSGANIAYISESLGHSELKTTQNYLDSFEKDERKKNAELLTKFKEKKE